MIIPLFAGACHERSSRMPPRYDVRITMKLNLIN